MQSSATIVAQYTRRAEASYLSASPLGPFGILNVKLRVVTPPRPLPLVSYHENAYYFINELFGKEFQIKAAQISSKSGIPDVDVTLTARGMFSNSKPNPRQLPQFYNDAFPQCPAMTHWTPSQPYLLWLTNGPLIPLVPGKTWWKRSRGTLT
jgi:hypothetical protein